MQISKQKLNKQVEKEIFTALYRVLADFKNPVQVESFFKDTLSKTERIVLAKRLGIAWYLRQNKSYQLIKKKLKVSSATIANVQSLLDKEGQGLKQALAIIEAEEWAGKVSKKISRSIKKVFEK